MKLMKRICATVLSLTLVLSINSINGSVSDAAKKPKLTQNSTQINVGKTATIKVKNGSKKSKVTWKTTKKSIVSITRKVTKGSKAYAKVKGVKAGKTNVEALYKVGKTQKKLVCKITVKDKISDVTQSALPAANTSTALAAVPTPTVSVQTTIKPTEMPTAVPTPTMPPSAEMKAFLDTITIPYSDEIRGNITLPAAIDDADVTWRSSNTDVITDKDADGKAAGVVTRGAQDMTIKLTATINRNSEIASKDIEVTVKQAPAKLNDEDFVGYLFGSFTGSESKASDEQIYFAVSENGYKYTDLNNRKPVLTSTVGEKGVRDPFICRSPEGDRFFLIATDLSIFSRGGWGRTNASVTGSHDLILWESTDLVNWGEPKQIKVAVDNAGMAWAPEMIYNDKTGEYVIFFASSIVQNDKIVKPNAIYCTRTRDFVNFSETELFIDNTDNREIIDTTMLKADDGYYYRASKDGGNNEANGGIRLDRATDIFGDWEKVMDLDELGFGRDMTNKMLEGPELFRFNKKDWTDTNTVTYGLFSDRYMEGSGYLPLTTTDLLDTNNAYGSWKLPGAGEYSFDTLKKRHGTILNITQEELNRVRETYKND